MAKVSIPVYGLTDEESADLAATLDACGATNYVFEQHSTDEMFWLNADELRPVLIGPGLQGSDVLAEGRRLRADTFCWGPIHLMTRGGPLLDLDRDWALIGHSMPPDVRRLAALLTEAPGISPARQREIIRAACSALVEDVATLRRAMVSATSARSERIQQDARTVLSLAPRGGTNVPEGFIPQLQRLVEAPTVTPAFCEELLASISAAEMFARRGDAADALPVALHRLGNAVRLGASEPQSAPSLADAIARRLQRLAARCDELPRAERARLRDACEAAVPVLQAIGNGAPDANALSDLAALGPSLAQVAYPPVPAAPGDTAAVARVLVVEDDDDWRGEIVQCLRDLPLPDSLTVEEAATSTEARQLLGSGGAALVLVDLGLPRDPGGRVLLDEGLELIRQVQAAPADRTRQHRFIVLTGAENHADAVRGAIALGVSPTAYLQKRPHDWQGELRARVRLLLQEPRPPRVHLALFRRSDGDDREAEREVHAVPRIVRVGDAEFTLAFPHWCLLAALADSAGRWIVRRELAERLLGAPYNLSPSNAADAPRPHRIATPSDATAEDTDDEICGEEAAPVDDPDVAWAMTRLPDYVYGLRRSLDEAMIKGGIRARGTDVIQQSPEFGYRLNAAVTRLDAVADYEAPSGVPRVLVVEDDPAWQLAIASGLTLRGFDPKVVGTVQEAEIAIAADPPQLVSLDLELPASAAAAAAGQVDPEGGLRVLATLRELAPEAGVAVLSAVAWKDALMLEMLRRGVRVDDYIQKQGETSVTLLAASLTRLRQEKLVGAVLLDWDREAPRHRLEIDSATRMLVRVAGHPVSVSGAGAAILRVLSSSPNRFVSRTQLIEAVWSNPDDEPDELLDIDNALDLHISRLRNKITKATGGAANGRDVIRGDRGVVWLEGNCVWVREPGGV